MASFINNMKTKVHDHKQAQSPSQQHDQKPLPAEPQHQQPQADERDNSAGNNNNDHENCLHAHNNARSAKGCKDLQWDDGLARDAETYAQKLASMNKMQHAGVQGQGENLYMSTAPDASFEQAVQSWLDEEKKYNGEKIGEGNFGEWGHFTQCLWHGTTHVGMGKAKSKDGATYIVARYTPQGNMAGEQPF